MSRGGIPVGFDCETRRSRGGAHRSPDLWRTGLIRTQRSGVGETCQGTITRPHRAVGGQGAQRRSKGHEERSDEW